MYDKNKVKNNIRMYKIKSNLTIEQISRYLGVSKSYTSLVLRGEVHFRIDILCRLCKLFKCSPNDILGDKFYIIN